MIRSALPQRTGGFTLMELMVVVGVVAILAALAYPGYAEQVRKTRRSDGHAALTNQAQRLERCMTEFSAYNHASCGASFPINSPEGHYQVSVVRTATTFTLTATPQGAQTSDASCGALTLTHTGVKGSVGPVDRCW